MKNDSSALKIAFVLDDGLDSEDGVQQYILTLGRWMQGQGHEVHYLVGETKRADIANVHSVPKNVKVKFNGNALTIPLPARKSVIKELLDTEQFDVIHVQVPYSPFFGAKVVKLSSLNTAVIGTFHILPYGLIARLGTRALGMILSSNLRLFDAHLAVSSSAQQFARETFKISPSVLPNVVDTNKFKPASVKKKSSNNRRTKVLFLGRLVERKGCAYLLEALGELSRDRPSLDFELTVCGKGPLDAELKEKAETLNIGSKVIFRGFVSEQEKIQAMQDADIAVFPSYAGESFGIVLIEAMAAGAGVVLGGDNPGYTTVLGENPETLIDVKNIKDFSQRLERFISDKNLRQLVHKSQQKSVQKYDVAYVGTELIKIYRNCKKALGD